MKKLFVICVMGCLFSGSAFVAEGQETGQEIGEWWTKSALSYDPILKPWLMHFEATVSYQNLSGNTEGTVSSIAPMLTVRKNRFSNYLGYSLTEQDMDYANSGSVDTRTETISEDLRGEILEWLFVAAGYRNIKDDLTYIDNRDTYFGGAGLSWSPIKDRLTMGIFVAYGDEDTSYVSDAGVPDEKSGGIYVQPTVQWAVISTVFFRGTGTYLQYSENDMGERWDVALGVDVALAPHVFLNLSWNSKYENNIAIRSNPDAEKTTTTEAIGLKLTY